MCFLQLSVLLTSTRKSRTNLNGTWTSDNLLSGSSNLALLGLNCNDIYAVETVDFIPIIEHYNRLRKTLNKVQNYNHPETLFSVFSLKKCLFIYLFIVFFCFKENLWRNFPVCVTHTRNLNYFLQYFLSSVCINKIIFVVMFTLIYVLKLLALKGVVCGFFFSW